MEFMIFGLLAGICCGLVPLTVAMNRNKANLGLIALGVCAISGLLLGLLLGIPMACIFTYIALQEPKAN
jgi:hypothetical protein